MTENITQSERDNVGENSISPAMQENETEQATLAPAAANATPPTQAPQQPQKLEKQKKKYVKMQNIHSLR